MWTKHVVDAIVPFLVVHQCYDAKGPKDLPPAKTFEIWLPEDEALSISDTLKPKTMVSRCNAKISRRNLKTKHSAKGKGEMVHVVSIREPLLTTLKELHYNPYSICWLLSAAVPEEEKCQAVSDTGDVIAKG